MIERPVILVTGASRGIGAAIARRVCARYRLALMARSNGVMVLADELGALGFQGSLTEGRDIEAFVARAAEHFGRIDGVVLNPGHAPLSIDATGSAADSGTHTDLLQISDVDWQAGFDMMFLSATRMLRHAVPHLRDAGGGSVVSISTFGAREPRAAYPVSSAIRAGTLGLLKLMSDTLATDGIRINSVLPGYLENWNQPEEVISSIPAGRTGALEEIAGTVDFLLSDAAAYITGQALTVDGGLTRGI